MLFTRNKKEACEIKFSKAKIKLKLDCDNIQTLAIPNSTKRYPEVNNVNYQLMLTSSFRSAIYAYSLKFLKAQGEGIKRKI